MSQFRYYNYVRTWCCGCSKHHESSLATVGRSGSHGYCHECIQAFRPRHWIWAWVPDLCFCCGWFGPGRFRQLKGWVICRKCHTKAIESSKNLFVNDCL